MKLPSIPDIGCHLRMLSLIVQEHLCTHKIMLCVWWTGCQVVHYELLQRSQMITADLYLQQLAWHHKKPAPAPAKVCFSSMTTPDYMSHEWSGIPYSNFGGRHCAIHLIHLILHQLITPSSTPWIITFMGNPLLMKHQKPAPAKPLSFRTRGLNSWRHIDRGC